MAAQDNWESRWEVVIGLETHTQLQTRSKIFSGAATAFGAEPNAQACAVDIALPGVLPVLNREAVVCAIKLGLAVGGEIAPRSIFARKNYFYPDLPKGYQISQYEIPVVSGGSITIRVGDEEKTVRLTRAHLEEDAGKSLHEDFQGKTGIDLNRAGTPLLEIVSEPDMRSATEAVAYAKALHALVQWIGICDGNMQEGSFRCDANVSVRRRGDEVLGTRREIKNLNSFKFMQQAIEYETQWQINEIEEGRKIQQATVLFDSDKGETRAMRSKEDAQDYRYFPDPDLLPLEINPEWIPKVRATMPESLDVKRHRYTEEYSLSITQAHMLTGSREFSEFYENTYKEFCLAFGDEEMVKFFGGPITDVPKVRAQIVLNWMLGKVTAWLNRHETSIKNFPISPRALAELIHQCVVVPLHSKMADEVFFAMLSGEGSADAIIKTRGLRQITDTGAIEKIIDDVLAANAKSVEEFRGGKDKAFNALVGQAMKATKGKANPQQVNDLLRKKLTT